MGFSIVGLTGGIGSGKSTVARFLADAGAAVVDADVIAREVVQPGTAGLREVTAAFGEDLLDEHGRLHRSKLASRVFQDARARRRLESILHPKIAEASAGRFASLAARGYAYVVYEAALIVESHRHESMAALIVVAATVETQMARVRARDGLTEAEARARIASQFPLERKIELADFVLWNDGSLEATRAKTEELYRTLETRFGSRA